MSSLKVAWDNSLAGQDRAGTGVYAARLLEQFVGRKDLRMEVLNGWQRNSSATGRVSRRLGTVGNLLWIQSYLPRILGKMKVDLLHSPAFIAPTVAPCPVVMTVHDITYLLFPSHFSRWWVTYIKRVIPRAMRAAAAIVCGSEHSRRDIIKAYDIAAHNVHVVPYGVDHDRFHPGAALDTRWADALGIRDEYLLHVGTFSYRKNIPTLLRAVAHLRSKGKWGKHQLVLAGSQSRGIKGGAEVLAAIRDLGLGDSVVLAGHVPDEHVAGLYAHASVLVMPSLYEGFGFPMIESMACGTPVLASNTSSLPEVGGDAAIFFPPQDDRALAEAIEDVLEKRTVAEELRSKGLKRAGEFTWQRTAEETLAIYRAVAKG